jgi:uncharacterized protein YdeI (YjbR/CyaY-like superfamily)
MGAIAAMKCDTPELLFSSRGSFREWLSTNAQTSTGVWLVFGKTKAVLTLTAAEALEEALCFGWIDGQMKSIDDTKYMKYFARRRAKSVWSDKNKKIVQALRESGLVTELGEQAIALAMQNGTWATQKSKPITEDEIASLAERLQGISPACENFMGMSPSVKRTYTAAYFAPKSDDARQRAFDRIVDRLNKNLKPM